MARYLLALLLLCAVPVFGQAGKAQLFGTILDPSGLPVRQARVQAEEQATMARYAAVSDERGEFRAEAFNVSNTPPLNDPNGSFGSPAFGTIISAGNPRDFEFVGKLHF
jgi:hypothetical protein